MTFPVVCDYTEKEEQVRKRGNMIGKYCKLNSNFRLLWKTQMSDLVLIAICSSRFSNLKISWFWCLLNILLTFVVHVALSGSTSLSNLCNTALGHRLDNLASMRNVSICKHINRAKRTINLCDSRIYAHTFGPTEVPCNYKIPMAC